MQSEARRVLGAVGYGRAEAAGRAMQLDEALDYALGAREAAVSSSTLGRGVLSQREQTVAELLADGMSNRRIAHELVIGERTVETHVQRILTKLGLSNRAQFIAWAAEQRLRS
jgi:DNA-binding NarL/FixJ family response regulator